MKTPSISSCRAVVDAGHESVVHVHHIVDGITIDLPEETNQHGVPVFCRQVAQSIGGTAVGIAGQRTLIVVVEPSQIEGKDLRRPDSF